MNQPIDNSKNKFRRRGPEEKVKAWLRTNASNVLLWSSFITVVLLVYHLFSDGDFSFLLTLGGIARCFAFAVLITKITTQKTCQGISAKSLQVYLIVFFSRLCSVLVYEGYLPFDKSGDWVYQFVEVTAFALCLLSLFLVMFQYRLTYHRAQDSFGKWDSGKIKVPSAFGVVWIILPALLVSMIIHPSLNGFFVTDVAWTFACYLETLAMVPQLWMFQQKKRTDTEIEPFTSHFVFALGAARVLHFMFWLSSYHELNDKNGGLNGFAGYLVLFAQFMQMVIMGSFFYYYLKSAAQGKPMEMPVHLSNV